MGGGRVQGGQRKGGDVGGGDAPWLVGHLQQQAQRGYGANTREGMSTGVPCICRSLNVCSMDASRLQMVCYALFTHEKAWERGNVLCRGVTR